MSTAEGAFLCVVASVILAVSCVTCYRDGYRACCEEMRNAAVSEGVAEYYLDDNNVRQWRWKGNQ